MLFSPLTASRALPLVLMALLAGCKDTNTLLSDPVTPAANQPPTAAAGADRSVAELSAVSLQGAGSDADGRISRFEWSQVSGPMVSLSEADTATARFTAPDVADVPASTVLGFRLRVTDDQGASAEDLIDITVLNNLPPVVDAGLDRTVDEMSLVSLQADARDSDGSIARQEWTQISGPMVALAGADTASASFTAPDVAGSTVLGFRIRVTDNLGASTEDEVSLTVLNNLPPLANAGADRNVDERASASLQGSGSDSDGRIARFAWTQIDGPVVSLSGADTAAPQFTAPVVAADAPLRFRLRVTDDKGASAEDEVTLTVINNLLPVASAGADQRIAEGAAVSLAGSGSDADGRIVGFAWTQSAGPAATLANANTANASFVAPAVSASSELRFVLQVTDDDGDTAQDELVITVIKNLPPVAKAGSDQTADEDSLVQLSGEATDPDQTPTSFSWSQLSGPAVVLSGADTATPSFTAPAVAGSTPTPVVLRLTVRDPAGLTATDDVSIAIADITTLSIADGHALEANDTTAPLSFKVSLSSAQPSPVTVNFATVAGTATERSDYTAATGALTFAAGETTKQIVVNAAGDVLDEPDETLTLNLTGLAGALPGRLSAVGTISEGACTPDNSGWQSYPHLIGSMHQHSGFSDGDVGSTPVDYFSAGRDMGLNFMGSAEHSDGTQIPFNTNGDCASADFFDCVNPLPTPDNPDASVNKWRDTEIMAVNASTPMFTAFRGYEYTTDRFGHINVFMSTNYALAKSDGGYALLEAFWVWLKTAVAANGGADGLVVFNHPGREDAIGPDDPAYAYSDFAYVSEADQQVVGVEMFGKGGDAYEGGNNAPVSGWFARGLDRGWHLGPIGSEDEHGREWAKPTRAKTVMIAANNQLPSLRAAMKARRFYAVAQNHNDLRLNFEAEGAPMGARLSRPAGHVLQIAAALTAGSNPGGSLELVSRNGQVVTTSNTRELAYQATVGSTGEQYFYLRVKRADGRPVAYSAPIWVRNAEYAACR